jgi:hypothetical protein
VRGHDPDRRNRRSSAIRNRRGSRQIVENDVKSHSRDAREQNAVREELARTLRRGCELTIGASIQVQELFTRWSTKRA